MVVGWVVDELPVAVDAFEAFVAFVDAVVVAVADVGAVVDVGAAAVAVGVDVVGLAAVDGDGAAGHDTGRSVTGDHGEALGLGEQPGLGAQVEWQCRVPRFLAARLVEDGPADRGGG